MGRGGEAEEVVIEERGGMDGWTPKELNPGRLEDTELAVVSLSNDKNSVNISDRQSKAT